MVNYQKDFVLRMARKKDETKEMNETTELMVKDHSTMVENYVKLILVFFWLRFHETNRPI